MIVKMYIGNLLTSAMDPMQILNGNAGNDEHAIKEKAELYFKFSDLYAILQRDAVLIAVISILMTLITMLFVGKKEKIAEMKKGIGYKLLIVFMVSSLLSILNLAIKFVSFIF